MVKANQEDASSGNMYTSVTTGKGVDMTDRVNNTW